MTQESTSPASQEKFRGSMFRRQWLGIVVIMLALTCWALIHAWGAYQSQSGKRAVLKGSLVLLSMTIFLSSWGVLLWFRQRRISRESSTQDSL